jgi:hypothetical protein
MKPISKNDVVLFDTSKQYHEYMRLTNDVRHYNIYDRFPRIQSADCYFYTTITINDFDDFKVTDLSKLISYNEYKRRYKSIDTEKVNELKDTAEKMLLNNEQFIINSGDDFAEKCQVYKWLQYQLTRIKGNPIGKEAMALSISEELLKERADKMNMTVHQYMHSLGMFYE